MVYFFRYFKTTRIHYLYISAAIVASIPFLLVVAIMLSAFTCTYYVMVKYKNDPFDDMFFLNVALEQYKLMYGDFGEIDTETTFQ